MTTNFRVKSANVSRFAMVPRSDVPRSTFKIQHTHKTTFDTGFLVPVYVDEILPGDSVSLNMTALARMMTPMHPLMDNLYLDTFFFFVPNRLVWDNWRRFMGEQTSPGASTAFLVPMIYSPAGGYAAGTVFDYFGLPTVGQIAPAGNLGHSALPLRAYNLIWNEWFRDQQLQAPVTVSKGDSSEPWTNYTLLRRGKRHDYFTSALPWPMRETSLTSADGFAFKGGAPVTGLGVANLNNPNPGYGPVFEAGGRGAVYPGAKLASTAGFDNLIAMRLDSTGFPDVRVAINDMRQAFAVQRLMEKDARGGSRYTEIVRAHFGVTSPDARMQRPEYLGGGSTPISINPIVQTSNNDFTPTPLGELGAVGNAVAMNHRFNYAATEHGYIIGLASIRADLTYQQGIERFWSRETKFDFYWPSLAMLGEQAVLRKEIYVRGDPAEDNLVFGYQERWAEYRYKPSRISGRFRSTTAQTLDKWHLAQRFTAPPVLNAAFIQDEPPMPRVLYGGTLTNTQQFLFDSLFDVRMTRPVPMFSVPGLADHF